MLNLGRLSEGPFFKEILQAAQKQCGPVSCWSDRWSDRHIRCPIPRDEAVKLLREGLEPVRVHSVVELWVLWARYPVMYMGVQVLIITTRLLTGGPLEVLSSLTQCRNCSRVVDGRERQVDLY